MTTPSGQISFTDIGNEFGFPPSNNLGAYRVNQIVGDRGWPLDDGVAIPGQTISFGQLRGKTLNIVVDYAGITEYNLRSSNAYDSSGVVIGGLKSRPASTSSDTKKVRHLIRKYIGGIKTPSTKVALETGSWNSSTVLLSYIIANGGVVSGFGGDGGRGGEGNKGSNIGPGRGQPGGPGFGASYPCSVIIESGGIFQGGFGGGGGGGRGYCDPDDNQQDPVATGGGGGGGAGLPAGSGGLGGTINNQTPWVLGANGNSGSITAGGKGGSGSNSFGQPAPRNCAWSGGGGGGGGSTVGGGGDGGGPGPVVPAGNGSSGTSTTGGSGGNGSYQAAAAGGANAYAIVYNAGITVNVTTQSGGLYYGGTIEGTF